MSMKPNKVPKSIIDQIFPLFLKGYSKKRMSRVTGLPEYEISEIIDNLHSAELGNLLSYNLVKNGRIGEDLSELMEINRGRQVLVEQGVLIDDALELLTDILKFHQDLGLDQNVFLPLFKRYCEAGLGRVETFQDFKINVVNVAVAHMNLEYEVNTLQQEYDALKGKMTGS